MARCKGKKRYQGRGVLSALANATGTIVNKAVDILPVELHLPGYQYCGPGTDLKKRLARGDPGINRLDRACKQHDIAYSQNSDTASRAKADRDLAERAWSVATSPEAGLAERAAAVAVTNIMKAKAKFGGGAKRQGKKKKVAAASKKGKGLYLRRQQKTGNGARHRQCKRRR